MNNLSLSIIVNAIVDNAKAGLAQTQAHVDAVKTKVSQLISRVDAATAQFILFGSIVLNVMAQSAHAVMAVTGHVVGLVATLLRMASAYLGLSVHVDTHNSKLKAANFLLQNFHKEVRVSLGFLDTLADYLNKLHFPIPQLTRFIHELSKAEIVLGIGRGKSDNLFDHLPESIHHADSAIKRFQQVLKNAQDDIRRDLQRFGAAAMAETVIEWRGVKFEGSFADVKKTVSAPVEALKDLRNELLELGANMAVPLDGLAKMEAIAGQMGFPTEELDDFVKLTAKGSVAFEIFPEQAAEAFGTLKNIYDLNLKELEFFGDQINYIADKAGGKVSESALLNVLTRAGGMAQRFGLLRGESVALGAAMLSMGKAPEIVGTALDTLLSKLQNAPGQNKDFQEGLQKLGINADELAQAIENHPKQALDDLLQKLAEVNSSRLQADILGKLIGDAGEAKGAVGDLISNLSEYRRLTGLANASDIAGSMDATFRERQKTVESALVMMKNAWDGVAISISSMFLPTIRAVAEGLRDVALWLRKVNDEYPNLTAFARIALIFGTLGNVLSLAFKALPGVAGSAGAAVGAAFRTGLVNGLRAAAGAVGPIVAGLWSTILGQFIIRLVAGIAIVQIGFSSVLGVIGALTSALITLVSNPVTLLLTGFGLLAARLVGATGVFARLGVAASGLGGIFMRLVGGPIGLVISALAFLLVKYNEVKDDSVALGKTTTTLSEIIDAAWTLVKERLALMGEAVGAIFDDIGAAMRALVGASDTSAEKVDSRWSGLFKGIRDLANSVIGVFRGIGSAFSTLAGVIVDAVELKFKHLTRLLDAAAKDYVAARSRFDFSGTNIKAAIATNQEENAQQKDQNKYAVSDALFEGYNGDHIQTFLDAIEAKILAGRTAPTSAAPDEQRKNKSDGGVSTDVDPAEAKKANQAVLQEQLSAIQTRQDALKSAHDLELKQLETRLSQEKLTLEQQVVNKLITEQQKNEQVLVLTKDLDTQKITLERTFIEQSSTLEKAAIVAKIQAEHKALASVTPATTSLAGVIAGGESGSDVYNAYNKGTKNHKIIPADKPVDLQALTIAEIQSRQALSIMHQDRLGAVGKYQLIEKTLKEAVSTLKLSSDTKFDAATQERIFTEYLVDSKRPGIKRYITGTSDDSQSAQLALAQEFRSVADPRTGLTYADKGQAANKASISTPQAQAALTSARAAYQQNVDAGMDKTTAYQQALTGGSGGSSEQRAEQAAKLKTLNNELLQAEQDRVAKLKSLGVEAQNNQIQQANDALAIKKQELDEQKALTEQRLQAEHDTTLDALALKEEAVNTELSLGNITDAEHLQQVREFADKRLAAEQKLLDEKRKLYDKDAVALAQNLAEKEALERDAALKKQQRLTEDANNQKAVFDGMMSPFKNAVQQMTNGVLTGQQTVSNAVKNAANSMLVTYASTFIQERAMQTAQWAWKLAGLAVTQDQEAALKKGDVIWTLMLAAKEKAIWAAHWAWETLGFAQKEATKQSISQGGVVWETLMAAKKKVVWAAEWAWETVGYGLKEARKRAVTVASTAFEVAQIARRKLVLAAEWAWEAIGFAAKNARKRALQLAFDAWDRAQWLKKKLFLVAQWAFEKLGFAETEGEKVATKIVAETAQTGAQVTGDTIRTTSAVASAETKKQADAQAASQSIFGKAYDAAAGVYSSLSQIPYVGWILAPIAAAATLAVVLGWGAMIGSAKGGEWEVGKDEAPYFLHKKESVLPAGVAENFRTVVNIVKAKAGLEGVDDATGSSAQMFNNPQMSRFLSDELPQLFASGALPTALGLPNDVVNLPKQSADSAHIIVEAMKQREHTRLMEALITGGQQSPKQTIRHGDVHLNVSALDGQSVKALFESNGDTIARIARNKLKSGKGLRA